MQELSGKSFADNLCMMKLCLLRWWPVSMRMARHWTVIEVSLIAGADATGQCYKALGFSPGFAPDAGVSPYLKLLPMLAGVGSPGTIQEVSCASPYNKSCVEHAADAGPVLKPMPVGTAFLLCQTESHAAPTVDSLPCMIGTMAQ